MRMLLFATIAIACLIYPAHAGITPVATSCAAQLSASATISCGFMGSTPVIHDAIFCSIIEFDNVTPSNVTTNAGDALTQYGATMLYAQTFNAYMLTFYVSNITANANAITVNWPSAVNIPVLTCDFAHVTSPYTLNVHGQTTQQATYMSSPQTASWPALTVTSGDYVFATSLGSLTLTAGSGFTVGSNINGNGNEYAIAGSSGSFVATLGITGTGTWSQGGQASAFGLPSPVPAQPSQSTSVFSSHTLRSPSFTQSVLTGSYGNARTGYNANETTLTQANVAGGNFHKLWSYATAGQMNAQPLIVSGVVVNGIRRSICIVSTRGNYVQAFDAGSPSAPLWTIGPSTFGGSYTFETFVDGITSTPVVDPATNVLYVASTNASGTRKLYAFNVADGTQFHAPVTPAATVSAITYVSANQLQRPALTLANGKIYVAWGSYDDASLYSGWVMSFDKTTLVQTGDIFLTDIGNGGSVWQGGRGLSVNGNGDLFFITANGAMGCTGLQNSFVRTSATLAVLDSVTPIDCSTLNMNDQDEGSGGAILIGNSYLVGGGKDGIMWLISQSNFATNQTWSPWGAGSDLMDNGYALGIGNDLFTAPSENSLPVKKFTFTGTSYNTTAAATSVVSLLWGAVSVSSNGSDTSSYIVWVNSSSELFALKGTDLSTLWRSGTFDSDGFATFSKFTPPTVANGLVYLATDDGFVNVYGLLQ